MKKYSLTFALRKIVVEQKIIFFSFNICLSLIKICSEARSQSEDYAIQGLQIVVGKSLFVKHASEAKYAYALGYKRRRRIWVGGRGSRESTVWV